MRATEYSRPARSLAEMLSSQFCALSSGVSVTRGTMGKLRTRRDRRRLPGSGSGSLLRMAWGRPFSISVVSSR